MNHCDARGYLVGPRNVIPADARQYAVAGGPLVGCSHVMCSACGALVRNWPGFRFALSPGTPDEYRALYETDDPDTSRCLTRDGGGALFRAYACRCSHTQISSATDLDRGFIEFDSWSCAGHPEA